MNRIPKLLATTMVALAATASPALAQSPADEVYNPGGSVLDVVSSGTPTPAPTTAPAATPAPASGVEDETASSTPTATPAKSSSRPETSQTAPAAATATPTTETQEATTGNLPFTGFEAGFVALAGLALLAGGFAMRRMSREQ